MFLLILCNRSTVVKIKPSLLNEMSIHFVMVLLPTGFHLGITNNMCYFMASTQVCCTAVR